MEVKQMPITRDVIISCENCNNRTSFPPQTSRAWIFVGLDARGWFYTDDYLESDVKTYCPDCKGRE